MRLRVLGPTELVGDDGPIRLPAKPRTLLVALALRRGGDASADELRDELWGESPPDSAPKLLQVYVSTIRKALPPGVAIRTSSAGYRLEMDPADLDAAEFERLAGEGRATLAAGNSALAASLLRRAAALWRGPALADVRYEAWATGQADRLEVLRERATEDRLDAELQLGRHADVLPELRSLVAADPTRESLVALAMLAAYRTDGAGEALALFERAAAALRDELGEDPSPELEALRRRIVDRDPGLSPPAPDAPRRSPPAAPNALIGRARELEALRDLLRRPSVRLISLTGAGGSGKSRVALELAHLLGPSFANGAAVVELAALSDPELVVPTIARALGVEPGADAFSALVDALAPSELLLVLDNMEHLREAAPSIVRLLAAAPRLSVVVTSRVVLHLSGEHVFPVLPLAADDAVALFAERARAHDPAWTAGPDAELCTRICARLDGLPLAIELAAARVHALGLRAVDARLASRLGALTGGPRDLPARQRTLRETLSWSAALLEPAHAAALARLAVFPASWSLDAAMAVARVDDDAVVALVDHSLVQAFDADGERRYRLLETVREFAYELLGDERREAEMALVAWVRSSVGRIDLRGPGPEAAVMHRLGLDADTIRDALHHARDRGDVESELAIVAAVWRYWVIRGALAEGRATVDGALDRRGAIVSVAAAHVARAAATVAWSMGDRDRATALAPEVLEIAVATGDPLAIHQAHNLRGVLATTSGDLALAEHHLREAIRIAEGHDLETQAATAHLNLGVMFLEAERLEDARRQFETVLAVREREASVEGIGFARLNLGETELLAANHEAAEAHYRAAAAAFASVGFDTRHANAIQGLAAIDAARGRHEEAARHLGAAAAIIDRGWAADGMGPVADAERSIREAIGDGRFEALFEEGRQRHERGSPAG